MEKAEEQIRRAMETGQFDNLPGKGKPLRLIENPHEDPNWRLAYHVLRNGGFSLPWIETRREIEEDIQAARTELARALERTRATPASKHSISPAEAEWKRAVELFRDKVAGINKRIFNYNLEAPSGRFQLVHIDVDRELWMIRSRPLD